MLTERVSNSPSGEYILDTISCLCNGLSIIHQDRQGNSYVIEVGVPLRYIATKICTLFWGGMKPPVTIACTMKTPMMGSNTNFAKQTERIAATGRREIGRGTFILAKDAPKSTRESGIVMEPRKAAIGERLVGDIDRSPILTNQCR